MRARRAIAAPLLGRSAARAAAAEPAADGLSQPGQPAATAAAASAAWRHQRGGGALGRGQRVTLLGHG
jgi:hypothetical protein